MHHLGIIFTDLKPENMVFVDGRTQAYINKHGKQEFLPIDTRIKLVDFGSAVYEPIWNPKNPKTEKFKHGYNYLIQTRHYRAPEVVLEMPWKRQVDIWSIGCVILEFLYGSMVFNTHCAIDHLNQMQKMIGKIPDILIQKASDKAYHELFVNGGKLNLEKAKISRAQAKPLRSYFNLDNIEHQALYDLVQRTLRWQAKDRISADAILRHAYFQLRETVASNQTQNGYHVGTGSDANGTMQSAAYNPNNTGKNGYIANQAQAAAAQAQAQAQATQQQAMNAAQAQALLQQQYLYQQQQAQLAAAQQQQQQQQGQYLNNNGSNSNSNGNYKQQPYITQ